MSDKPPIMAIALAGITAAFIVPAFQDGSLTKYTEVDLPEQTPINYGDDFSNYVAVSTPRNLSSEPIAYAPRSQSDLVAQDVIEVDLSDRQLCYLNQCFYVGIGASESPTPLGTYPIWLTKWEPYSVDLVISFKEGYNPAASYRGTWAIHTSPNADNEYSLGCILTDDHEQKWLLASISRNTLISINP